jgi:hypothetical protein
MTIHSCRCLSRSAIFLTFSIGWVLTTRSFQENYLKTQPAAVRDIGGPEKILKQLKMMDRAASSISDGDLVDALIHG